MAVPVIMPKMEMTQESATVVEWLKKEGERVEKGEPILTIETDKITMDIESPASGILAGINVKPGDVVPVTTVIAYILQPGEELPERPEGKAPEGVSESGVGSAAPPRVAASPVAEKLARGAGIDIREVKGSGPGGKVMKSDVEAYLAARSAGQESKVAATPAARKAARELGVDLSTLRGTGPRGRIQKKDVEQFASARVTAEKAVPPLVAGEERVVPLTGMRKRIAERMSQSYRSAPHITFTVSVDMLELLNAREQMIAASQAVGGEKISVTALLVKAVAWGLVRHPLVNSVLKEDGIHVLPFVNVGIAVALDDGLIVPVVKDANVRSVSEIAKEVNELTVKARSGKLTPQDVSGGTFTISNLGPFGVEEFTAIINPPQSGILAVGAVRKEVVVGPDDRPVVRPIMKMTLSVDHRVLDGAEATRFLMDVKEALEHPTLMLL